MDLVIRAENLKKSFKKRLSNIKINAVNGLTFSIKRGEIVGLLGPNGAGKTTTIKMICGLVYPDEGNVEIKGFDSRKNRLKALEHISAVLEGNRNLYWRLTVRENLEYFIGNRGVSRKDAKEEIDYLLDMFQLSAKEHELVNRLSRGMQQKLAIAVAILAKSELILLDEPTLGLDVETSYEIREILLNYKNERTIIISSHDMDVIQQVCDRVIIINEGEIITDDKVVNLLKLFEKKLYRITLEGSLTKEQIQLLENSNYDFHYTDEQGYSLLEIEIAQGEQLYTLFELLKKTDILIESIQKKEVNFEKVFLNIIKGEKVHALG